MNQIKYILFKLSSINGTKQLLFGICLILMGIWSYFIGSESGIQIFELLCFVSPIIGCIFALSGLLEREK